LHEDKNSISDITFRKIVYLPRRALSASTIYAMPLLSGNILEMVQDSDATTGRKCGIMYSINY